MIEDLGGAEVTRDRRPHMLAVSFGLLVAVIVGFAVVSSPQLRGPFATPRPSSAVAPPALGAPSSAPRFTAAPLASFDPAQQVPFIRISCTTAGDGRVVIFNPGAPAGRADPATIARPAQQPLPSCVIPAPSGTFWEFAPQGP